MYRVPNYKVQLVRDGSVPAGSRLCKTPRAAADLFRAYIGDSDREHLVAMFLDAQNRFIGLHTISVGTIDYSVVHPREVFKAAILCNSAGLILAHNHPSGDHNPSNDDIAVTRELQRAADLMNIPIMDHLIIGEPGYTSFLEIGMLEPDVPPKRRPAARRKSK
jgi:DNA repair protein RadC